MEHGGVDPPDDDREQGEGLAALLPATAKRMYVHTWARTGPARRINNVTQTPQILHVPW